MPIDAAISSQILLAVPEGEKYINPTVEDSSLISNAINWSVSKIMFLLNQPFAKSTIKPKLQLSQRPNSPVSSEKPLPINRNLIHTQRTSLYS